MSLNRLGLVKTSLIDYPGEVSAVLFTVGCNLRCPFCHNPELVHGAVPEDFLPLSDVIAFLQRRSRLLGGVCITGGEPLIHTDLGEVVREISSLGLKVKIDTNGTYPVRLVELKPDFVALDVKTSPSKYGRLISDETQLQLDLFGAANDEPGGIWSEIQKTIDWILSSGVEHEFRTTVVPDLVTPADIEEISGILADSYSRHQGANQRGSYTLSGFRAGRTLDPSFGGMAPYPEDVLLAMMQTAVCAGLDCSIRWNRDTATI